MEFWVTGILLACAISGILIYFLLGHLNRPPPLEDQDVELYKLQISEVERELSAGILEPDMAEQTRNEIARRLLAADRHLQKSRGFGSPPSGISIAFAVLLFLLLVPGSLALYAFIGAPGVIDMPIAKRIQIAEDVRRNRLSQAEFLREYGSATSPELSLDPQYQQLVDELRRVVAERPTDSEGIALLASTEGDIGNFVAAAEAMQSLIQLLGDTAGSSHFAQLAEYLILSAKGYVSPEAETALVQSLELDSENPGARYYLGLMYAQTGRPDYSYRLWTEVLARERQGSPLHDLIRSQMPAIAKQAGLNYVPAGDELPNPTQDQVAAAEELSDEQRNEMIRSMVESLSLRIANEGGSAAEHARLIHSLAVLGEYNRARTALRNAKEQFAGDSASLELLSNTAKAAGLAE